ncbi:MAG: hypothetical protein Q8Q94_04450 [bacterium]|nr:hypothetical protein [bacterium]MDZ4299640.1 hypothetical protein [Candidatus Sungbacteria bacterium]
MMETTPIALATNYASLTLFAYVFRPHGWSWFRPIPLYGSITAENALMNEILKDFQVLFYPSMARHYTLLRLQEGNALLEA